MKPVKVICQRKLDHIDVVLSTPQAKLEKFWSMFKVYANNPSHLISTTDKLKNLLGNKQDLNKICWSLGIDKFSSNITFGTLLNKIGIAL